MKIKLDENARMPVRAYAFDAGIDIMSPCEAVVLAGHSTTINTGVHVEIPCGYAGFLKSKSGLNVKHGIVSDGVIDCGYTGSIKVKLYNHSQCDYIIHEGDKITQLVVIPCRLDDLELVDSLEVGERGDNGFGSTGK